MSCDGLGRGPPTQGEAAPSSLEGWGLTELAAPLQRRPWGDMRRQQADRGRSSGETELRHPEPLQPGCSQSFPQAPLGHHLRPQGPNGGAGFADQGEPLAHHGQPLV